MTPGGTLGLCCVHIAQLMTHLAIYTLPFTLQLCYNPPGIIQRYLRVKRVVYQVMIDYKHFIPSTLVDISPRIFEGGCRVAGIFVLQKPCKIVRKTLKQL